jgi:hypothetical protein
MARTINVTLTMVLHDEDDQPLDDARSEEMVDITEYAIRARLMGAGFLPDDVFVESYGFSHTVED